MIEGLKVTVAGTELKFLCITRATHHRERVKFYAEKVEQMSGVDVKDMTNGDPAKQMRDRVIEHTQHADEFDFIAAHIVTSEEYRLAREDLFRLGIVAKQW